MIGVPARSAPSRRATSKPSMSGSITSSTIRSGRNAATAASASAPVPADSTAKPWKRRAIEMTSTMFGSSSTTRTRFDSFIADSIGREAVSFLGGPERYAGRSPRGVACAPTMRAPFQLDLHVPNFNWPDVAPEDLFEQLANIATTAEDSGFSSISMMDHYHQIPGVGPQTNYMFEGNTMLAALAARTSKASLGLLVGGVMYRNPAALAKITTGIDVISGGRAVLGLGAAWFEDEHNAYGFDFPPLKERFERLEDALNIARKMFTEDVATYEGKHHSIHGAINNPRPLRGDIPILIGGSGEKKTLRMVAQYADGSNFFGDLERVKHLLGVLEGHCEQLGRDMGEITKTRMGTLFIARDPRGRERQGRRRGRRRRRRRARCARWASSATRARSPSRSRSCSTPASTASRSRSRTSTTSRPSRSPARRSAR